MVLTSDGTSELAAYAWRKLGLFWEKIQFVAALDLIKCRKQIKQQRLFPTVEFIFELPSNISTMHIAHKNMQDMGVQIYLLGWKKIEGIRITRKYHVI